MKSETEFSLTPKKIDKKRINQSDYRATRSILEKRRAKFKKQV